MTLIAAAITALATTVMAISPLRDLIFGGSTQLAMKGQTKLEKFDGAGEDVYHVTDLHYIWLDAKLERDLPHRLERYYQPVLHGGWRFETGFATSEWKMMTHWVYEDDPQCWLTFTQTAGSYYAEDRPFDSINTPWNAPLKSNAVEIGDYSVFQVSMPTYSDGIMTMRGFRQLYWTDGCYIFTLNCPYEMEDAEIAGIMASITEVQDTSPYLKN